MKQGTNRLQSKDKYLGKKAVWKDAPFKPVKGRIVAEGKGYYYDFKTGKSEDMYFLNFEGYPIEYGVWLRSKECDWDDYVEEKIWGEESPEVDDGQESEDK